MSESTLTLSSSNSEIKIAPKIRLETERAIAEAKRMTDYRNQQRHYEKEQKLKRQKHLDSVKQCKNMLVRLEELFIHENMLNDCIQQFDLVSIVTKNHHTNTELRVIKQQQEQLRHQLNILYVQTKQSQHVEYSNFVDTR